MQRRNSRGRELELETANATTNPVSKPTETIEQKHNEQHYSSGQPALVSAEEDQTIQNSDERKYLTGWRLHCLSAALWISLFLSTLETTIVSTALVSITNALNGFILRDWIVTSYLLTYTGFLVIYAKLSDVFGKKTMLLLALLIFTVFSGLCGAANNIVDLIILRAFQGIGASGIYAMILAIAPSLVPIGQYAKYMGIMSTVFIAASVLGPILGGVISQHSTWRWVFLLNIPGGVIAFVMVSVFLPASEESSRLSLLQALRSKVRRSNWVRIDVLGILLLLAASVLLVFALEEGGTRYPWSSAVVISSLVLAVALFIAFGFWEVHVEQSPSKQEPVFPPSICKDRISSAMLLTTCFVGFPFVSMVVNIPQRAQAVYGMSPSDAGLILLPMMLTSPAASVFSAYLTGNAKIPPVYPIVVAAALQVLGVGLTCSLPTHSTHMPNAQYGYEVLMGIGFGLSLATILTFARVVVSEANLPVMMGALTQIRVLGGTVSLAICATILNNHLKPKLDNIVSPEQAKAILDSVSAIDSLRAGQRLAVRRAFAEGYNLQNIFMAVMSAAGLISSLFLWERHPRKAV
ncbi:major facilitator superfamily domain-containing protein [Fusarium tricinctum]|uniref:Major facilitator superfamily domain-containing protein n=1 Tax=Fusarium tricinctum TaxID=61284 RepID=A0A8K0RLY0_9HYPO|nr:major facilitator superfamily domain-containing protein [Fusarium tricinctum]